MQSSITIITTGDYAISTLNHRFSSLPCQFATLCDLVVLGWVVLTQVIRKCDNNGGFWASVKVLSAPSVSVQINVCTRLCLCLGLCLHTRRFNSTFLLHARVYVCASMCVVFMDLLFPSQGERGLCGGWFGDSKCMVPQSLRPLNYLSSLPWCKGQCTIIGSPSYCAAHWAAVQPTGWQDVTTTPVPLHAY